MGHYARIKNNTVSNVIVATQDVIDSGLFGDPKQWVQTSYNTRGNKHYAPDGLPDDAPPLRGEYAGIGFSYDTVRDVFVAPKSNVNHGNA